MKNDILNIQITWQYFLGIVGFLIITAWYGGNRLSKIETSISWLTQEVKEIRLDVKSLNNDLKSLDNKVSTIEKVLSL